MVEDLNVNFFDYENNELAKKKFQYDFTKCILASHREENQANETNNSCNRPHHN